MSAEYLVTGGAGFIGSNMVRALLEQGSAVRVLDNLSTGRRENLAGLEPNVEFQVGDLRDEAAVARAVAGVRYVLHVGALSSVSRSVQDPAATHGANITGTLNILVRRCRSASA